MSFEIYYTEWVVDLKAIHVSYYFNHLIYGFQLQLQLERVFSLINMSLVLCSSPLTHPT